jgi:cellulose biosynthesis protein BcsQ
MSNIYLKQQIISFYSMQGGSGKSTAALNLAWFLQDIPKAKVLFMDFNFSVGQSDIAMKMNFPACPNLCSFIEKIDNPYIAYKESILSFKDFKIHFIQPPLSLLQSDKLNVDMLNELIYLARNDYDFIIADLPPRYDNTCMEMLNISTIICFVSTMDSIQAARIANFLDISKPLQKCGLIINDYVHNDGTIPSRMENIAGIPLYAVLKKQEPKNSRRLAIGGFITSFPDLQREMVDLAGRMLLT